MNSLAFVTSNPGKVESLRAILKESGVDIPIDMLDAEYPEDKSLGSTEAIAREGAAWCAEKFQRPVLVTDTGIFISALGGYPGINTAVELKRIGVEGITNQLKGTWDRSAQWMLSLGYAAPGKQPEVFTATIDGSIPREPEGEDGFGFDSIFIPKGESNTLAEDINMRDRITPFRVAVEQFAGWYHSADN